MEKLNIAELLKDCPQGMELYSPIFGNVYLDKIRPYLAVVVSTSDKQKEEFLYDGRFGINGECMLFPSKENRDWSTFQRPFKDGDILAYQFPGYTNPSIYIHKYSQKLNTAFYVALSGNGNFMVRDKYREALYGNDSSVRFAFEEEKQKLFDAIKANGYKWNAKTKTLEKLEVKKFDITTLKPFKSRVLVRSGDNSLWKPAIFGCYVQDAGFFALGGTCWMYCIPFENNEHLLSTTNDCDDFYKTWE